MVTAQVQVVNLAWVLTKHHQPYQHCGVSRMLQYRQGVCGKGQHAEL